MKKLCLLIAVFTVISCKNEAPIDYAVISGKIINKVEAAVSINNTNGLIKKIIEVSEDGNFVDTLKFETGRYIIFDGKNRINIYLEPGNNININYDANNFLNSLSFEGIGSEISSYILNKGKKQYEILGAGMGVYELEEDAYKTTFAKVKSSLVELINGAEGISEEYKLKELRNIHYSYLNKLSIYERYHERYAKKPGFKTSDGFLSELDGLDYNNEDDFLFSADYESLVTAHYSKEALLLAQKDSIANDLAYLKVAANIENEIIKNELLFSTAKYAINYTKELEEFYKTYMAASVNEDNNKIITESYNKLVSVYKGKSSPKFLDYENNEGGTTSLDDLKGKFVYINVWATWSAPCTSEIPFLKEVEKKYDGKNIAFVSISVDKTADHDKWGKMIEEKELPGIQLFAENSWQSDFIQDYLIKGIPRFILIDPEGNIVNSNAPKPSDDNLINLFNEQNI